MKNNVRVFHWEPKNILKKAFKVPNFPVSTQLSRERERGECIIKEEGKEFRPSSGSKLPPFITV